MFLLFAGERLLRAGLGDRYADTSVSHIFFLLVWWLFLGAVLGWIRRLRQAAFSDRDY
jgi:hypothetical protein